MILLHILKKVFEKLYLESIDKLGLSTGQWTHDYTEWNLGHKLQLLPIFRVHILV